jgi:DNA-binding NarL/FixJ family response regulator
MPVLDGLAATQALAADPDCASRVLVLTTFDDDGCVFAALEAAPAVTTRLVREVATRRRDPDSVRAVQRLSPRETEVLGHVADGRSNAEIAAALVLSEATVKTHVARILAKLGARDRVQAVVTAHRSGLAR